MLIYVILLRSDCFKVQGHLVPRLNTEVEGDRTEHNITENEIEKGEYRNEILHEENCIWPI